MSRASGTVGHACATKCGKRRQSACVTLKKFVNVSAFSNRTEREDKVVSQDDHALYLLRWALLSRAAERMGGAQGKYKKRGP